MKNISLTKTNIMRIKALRKCITTKLCDEFSCDHKKKYLIIENAVAYFSSYYAKLNLIIMENDATPTEEYGEMPHLTISYIKRNIEFFFMKHKFHFDDFNENHRERFLFKAIDNISDIIENSQPGQVIQFETPVELYAQGAWDRKRGTFDGYCNGLPPQKLYGETMYEFLIVGVEISSIG